MNRLKNWREIPIGGIITNTPTSLEYKTGSWRALKPILNREKCVKCLLCWVYCPEPAIYRHEDNSVEIDYNFCKGCGICENVCPTKAITMIREGE